MGDCNCVFTEIFTEIVIVSLSSQKSFHRKIYNFLVNDEKLEILTDEEAVCESSTDALRKIEISLSRFYIFFTFFTFFLRFLRFYVSFSLSL